MARVLLVDDDPALRAIVGRALAREGHEVEDAGRLAAASAACLERRVDVLLLDLGLPDGDGLEFLAALPPSARPAGIVVLSARGQESVKVAALDLGADDYLTKPFGVEELRARLRALDRRRRADPDAGALSSFGDIVVDRERRLVTRGGEPVRLTPHEYELLLYFLDRPGILLTTRNILRAVWRRDDPDLGIYVRVYVGRLRKKLETDPRRPRHLVTETGLGYRFLTGEEP